MKKSLLNLFVNNLDEIIYEIDISAQSIKWHNDVLKKLFFSDIKSLTTCEQLSFLIHKDDKELFCEKIHKKENGKIKYRIKDAFGKYHTWEDNYVYYKDNNEEILIGVCKDISKEEEISKELIYTKNTSEDILDNTDDLFFYKDLNFKYIGCNNAFCEFVGLPKDEILGKDDFELFGEKHASFFRTNDIKMLETRKRRTNKEYVTYPDGREVLLLTQKSPLIDKNNNTYGILGISRDITLEMNYKKELVKSRKSYQKLFEANKIPVLIVCPEDGTIVNANSAALRFYEYSLKEIRNLTIHDINTNTPEEIKEEMQSAKNEKRDCFNFRHITRNGKEIDVEVYSGPIKHNRRTVLYSIIFDITKRKKAEEKLNQAHTIYQNTKEGIFITDLKGKFLSVNKAFEDIIGYKESEVVGLSTNILKSHKHSKTFYENFWTKLIQKGSWEGEIINKTKDGMFIPQWLTINTVYDNSSKPINYIAVFTDFSKLKKQEKLLREKDQLMYQQSKMASMGEMLRNIAHQWRQPLSAISSSATGMKLKKDFDMLEDDDFNKFTEGILKSTTYLSETIEDFSNYFKHDVNRQTFKIKETIEKACQLMEASLKNHDIKLKTKVSDDYEIVGIKNELVQVLINIVNNSKDAFKTRDKKDRKVLIEVTSDSKNLIIQVKDNAGGIDNTILEKIFEPYFTTKHQSQGTGIGLYMSREIIQDHFKGSINGYNIFENDEYGVEFRVIIPLA